MLKNLITRPVTGFFSCLLLWLFMTLPTALPAQAQDMIPTEQEKQPLSAAEIFEQLPPEIQEELKAEADTVFRQCEQRTYYARLHDCGCIAISFLDQRILQGPNATNFNLWQEIGPECINVAGMAGDSYESCTKRFFNQEKYNEFCECYANTMADKYKKSPIDNSYHLSNLSASAYTECHPLRPPG